MYITVCGVVDVLLIIFDSVNIYYIIDLFLFYFQRTTIIS